MNLKEFGLFFADLREKSGYRSQRELAEKSGVSHSTINRLEAGTHKTSIETLKSLAPYLKGIEYNELIEKAGYLKEKQGTVSSSDKEDRPDELTTIMYHKWDQLDDRRRKQALKLIEILQQEADEENNKN